ncbi:MAG: M67 family metallopeptidase [Tannerella sp.]|jgi:proteasome lid subunit RPN8/RPN11|nr:M67 family metallopeptidase [Tannerella sp.]
MIRIPRDVLDAMIRQAGEELPDEACGLLTGTDGVVQARHALTNMDHSPEHFSFSPQEQFNVLKEARRNGRKIIANYHSHPASPARPSEEDIRLALDSQIVYVIISLAAEEPVVKAFHIADSVVRPCEIVVSEIVISD